MKILVMGGTRFVGKSLVGKLLNNKDINFKNRTRMLDVYRDWHELNNTSTLDDFI